MVKLPGLTVIPWKNIIDIESVDAVVKNLCHLKEAGVKIVIDDFEIENSSFRYMQKFKVDGIKIDSLFVNDIKMDVNKAIYCNLIRFRIEG